MRFFDLGSVGFSDFFRRFVTGREAQHIDGQLSDHLQLTGRVELPALFGDSALSWACGNSVTPGVGNSATLLLSTDAPGGAIVDAMFPITGVNAVNRFSVGSLVGGSFGTFESSCDAWGSSMFNRPTDGAAGLVTGVPFGTVTLRSFTGVFPVQQSICTRYDLSDNAGASPFLHPLGIYIPRGVSIGLTDLQTNNVFAATFVGRAFPVEVPDFVTANS